MKSFIRAITITIVLNLMLAGLTIAQVTPAPAPPAPAPPAPAPAPAAPQAVSSVNVVDGEISRLGETFRDLINMRAQQSGGRVLVIPTAEIEPQDLVTMMEDMTVMCRIFDKRLEQSNLVSGRFTTDSRIILPTPFSWGSRSTGAMYIQGYGALFLTRVDFLLSPPPEAPEEKETKEEEDVDPVWEQMKQEMYEPEDVSRRRRTGDRPEEKYDAEKVEELKETLIKALKHAANIRNLNPDESVILTVTGKASQSGPFVTGVYKSGDSKYITTGSAGAGSGSLSPMVLTIRAKKSDIDDFAEDKLSFEKFAEKTQLLSYSYLSENVGGPSRSSSIDMYYGGRTGIRSRDRRR